MKRVFNNRFQKAAMFGLDARIALAIFAGLSAITGVALYSAIRQANAVSVLSDMREVGKAWEQYYLDTGQDLPRNSADPLNNNHYIYQIAKLVEDSGISGWKGPYLSYAKDVDYRLKGERFIEIYIMILKNGAVWGDAINIVPAGFCTEDEQCSAWVRFGDFKSTEKDLIEKIDAIVDSGDGAQDGNFRWYDNTTDYQAYLKYAPMKG